jgi:diaminopimelate decarboxylase
MMGAATSSYPHLAHDAARRLVFDGCDAIQLAELFGTPFWVISESTVRHSYRLIEAPSAASIPTRATGL